MKLFVLFSGEDNLKENRDVGTVNVAVADEVGHCILSIGKTTVKYHLEENRYVGTVNRTVAGYVALLGEAEREGSLEVFVIIVGKYDVAHFNFALIIITQSANPDLYKFCVACQCIIITITVIRQGNGNHPKYIVRDTLITCNIVFIASPSAIDISTFR